jgi:hypothetical protein
MDHSEVLLTLCEVSVAFAGFSGVVAVFGRLDIRDWSVGDRYRFYALVETSLAGAFLSLLPFGLFAVQLPPEFIWRSASILSVVFIAASYVPHILGFRSVPAGARSGDAWADIYVSGIIDVLVVGLNLYNVMISGDSGLFLMALILLVTESGFFFARLLFQALSARRAA